MNVLLGASLLALPLTLLRAWRAGRSLSVPSFSRSWLVLLGYLPQWIAFYLPATRSRLPDPWVPFLLTGSLLALLLFAWSNRHVPGFKLMGLGVLMNLLVIGLNGGWMPISTQTVVQFMGEPLAAQWPVGERLGLSKDRVMEPEQIRLPWLADRFILPAWVPQRVAFSVGDVLIATGVWLFLWSLGGPSEPAPSAPRSV